MRLGYAPIDDEHERLIGLAHAVRALLAHGAELHEISHALEQLRQVTREHFAHEEGLMRQYGCPDLAAHLADHEELVCYLDSLTGGGVSMVPGSAEAIEFLESWVTEHLVQRDVAAMRYVLARMESPQPAALLAS